MCCDDMLVVVNGSGSGSGSGNSLILGSLGSGGGRCRRKNSAKAKGPLRPAKEKSLGVSDH